MHLNTEYDLTVYMGCMDTNSLWLDGSLRSLRDCDRVNKQAYHAYSPDDLINNHNLNK